jgi:hypothetical protein
MKRWWIAVSVLTLMAGAGVALLALLTGRPGPPSVGITEADSGRVDRRAGDFAEVDYGTVDRRIAKEPRYVAAPRYGLLVLDPAGAYRVWAVFDKSRDGLSYYDVLYLDLNADGDLTGPGERFVGRYDESAPKGRQLTIPVGEVRVPGTALVHTDLLFTTIPYPGRGGFWLRMKWGGTEPVDGGYGPLGTGQTEFAATAAAAPVLRPTPLGRLSFVGLQPADELVLPAGKASDIQVGIGSAGSGPDTLCVLSEHFLVPGGDVIEATLIARDEAGQEVRVATELKGHC